MAASTADIAIDAKVPADKGSGPIAASTTLYKGIFANYNSSGYLVSATDADEEFAGIVDGHYDNSAGSAGAMNADLYTSGKFEVAAAGLAITDVGKPLYIVDNQTVQTGDASISNGVYVGTLAEYISATRCVLELDVKGNRVGRRQQFAIDCAGVNATTIDMSTSAGLFGGSDLYVTSVVALYAMNTTAGNAEALTLTTDYTVASGAITLVGDRSAAGTRIIGTVIGWLKE
jgi:hypothetical protein